MCFDECGGVSAGLRDLRPQDASFTNSVTPHKNQTVSLILISQCAAECLILIVDAVISGMYW